MVERKKTGLAKARKAVSTLSLNAKILVKTNLRCLSVRMGQTLELFHQIWGSLCCRREVLRMIRVNVLQCDAVPSGAVSKTCVSWPGGRSMYNELHERPRLLPLSLAA